MKRAFLWGVPIAILIGLVAWRFLAKGPAQGAAGGQRGGRNAAAPVRVAKTTSRVIVQNVQSVGNVESPYKIEVSPKTSGRIEYLQAREGDSVKPGEVLVKIDPSDLKGAVLQQQASVAEARSRLAQAKLGQGSNNVGISSQIEQQRAALTSAQANYNQVQQNYNAQVASAQSLVTSANSGVANALAGLDKENASLVNAQSRYDRQAKLNQLGYVATQDVEDARTALEVQRTSVQIAKGQVTAARSLLDQQQQNLSITKRKGLSDIAASKALVDQAQATLKVALANRSQGPAYQQNLSALQNQVDAALAQLKQAQARLADTVLRSNIAGTVTARKADPGAIASPGSPVLEIQFLDWIYITTTLPIDTSAAVHTGQSASITIDGLPGRTFNGPITNINPAADPQSRQFGLKVRLENQDHSVRPGMYARVTISTGRVQADVVVPREALVTSSDGTSTVTVVGDDNVAHVRSVKTGVRDEAGVQILEGVQAGESVVVLTFNPLREGQKVTITEPGTGGGAGKGRGGRGTGGKDTAGAGANGRQSQ